MASIEPLTVGELFAGIGGIGLGLERAGMEVRWAIENDPYACAVYRKNFPDVELIEQDITTVDFTELERVDLLSGGFPCQDISYAGKGAGIEGERSGLWKEFWRAICEIRPRLVLVENVPALLSRGLGCVLGDLASIGYDAEWDCIPAAAVGAPHRRDRVFVVAHTRRGKQGKCCDPDEVPLGGNRQKGSTGKIGRPGCESENVADTESQRGRQEEPIQTGRNTVGIRGEILAHTERSGRLDSYGDNREHHEARRSRGGTEENDGITGEASRKPEDVADAEVESIGIGLCESGEGGQRRGRSSNGSSEGERWSVEPSIRGVVNGISKGLDGVVNGGNRVDSVGSETQTPENRMRTLWEFWSSIGTSSHRRRSDEQLTGELIDALSEMPHDNSLAERKEGMAQALAHLSCMRQAITEVGSMCQASVPLLEAWASLSGEEKEWAFLAAHSGSWWSEWPGVGRVAKDIPSRVDRLRCLGNAVVPQVAEWIGRRIMEVYNEEKQG